MAQFVSVAVFVVPFRFTDLTNGGFSEPRP